MRASRWRMRSVLGAVVALAAIPASASAAVTPSRDANVVAAGLAESLPPGVLLGAEFQVIPPAGNPAGFGDSDLASFPIDGSSYSILSTGDTDLADDPNSSPSSGANNGGDSAGHGNVFDVVTLRLDFNVPPNLNCLTFDYRLLSEEFPEFIGSDFNDGFVAEVDVSDFDVANNGNVTAQRNFAVDADGRVTTVNTTGTASGNAIGTTYDGATPILRATTPLEPGAHPIFLSVYDASDAVYDTSVFVDNMQLRNVNPSQCLKGAQPTKGFSCSGEMANVFAVDGVATGTKDDDVIRGSSDDDTIKGRGGNDVICGKGGDDEVKAGNGDDKVKGNKGDDVLKGRTGDDTLKGKRGADTLRGQGGTDKLRGMKGGDTLRGGGGEDDCKGGPGNDSTKSCES